MTRGDQYRVQAAQADTFAADATDPEIKRELLELAQCWRDLARQADEIEAAARNWAKSDDGRR